MTIKELQDIVNQLPDTNPDSRETKDPPPKPRELFREAWPWALAPAVIVLVTLLVIGADIMTVLAVTGAILAVGALLTFILVFSER